MVDELRKLADDLCDLDGTWTTSASSLIGGYSSVICDQIVVAHCFREEVSAFIAAASPAAIIALLDEISSLTQHADILQRDVEAFSAERDAWQETAAQHCRNEEYYRDLIDQVAPLLGPPMYTQDDGGVVPEPLRACLPKSVARLLAERDEARAAVKRLAGALEDIHVEQTDWPVKREALADPVVRRIVEE